jgi:hypothetical protein
MTSSARGPVIAVKYSNAMWLHQIHRDLARYNVTRRNRSALAMTETEERLIAAAAIIGDRSSPVTG